jgi:hypothetical protein
LRALRQRLPKRQQLFLPPPTPARDPQVTLPAREAVAGARRRSGAGRGGRRRGRPACLEALLVFAELEHRGLEPVQVCLQDPRVLLRRLLRRTNLRPPPRRAQPPRGAPGSAGGRSLTAHLLELRPKALGLSVGLAEARLGLGTGALRGPQLVARLVQRPQQLRHLLLRRLHLEERARGEHARVRKVDISADAAHARRPQLVFQRRLEPKAADLADVPIALGRVVQCVAFWALVSYNCGFWVRGPALGAGSSRWVCLIADPDEVEVTLAAPQDWDPVLRCRNHAFVPAIQIQNARFSTPVALAGRKDGEIAGRKDVHIVSPCCPCLSPCIPSPPRREACFLYCEPKLRPGSPVRHDFEEICPLADDPSTTSNLHPDWSALFEFDRHGMWWGHSAFR